MYAQLPPGSYPLSTLVSTEQTIEKAEAQILATGISYPFVAKPDIGMMGLMVRKISTAAELREYHERIGAAYICLLYTSRCV